MTSAQEALRIATDATPSDVRLLSVSLDEHAQSQREQHDQALRQEGLLTATQELARAFDEATAALEQERTNLLTSLSDMTATLAAEVAQTLLCKELSEGNYDIAAIVRDCLSSTGSSPGETIIHVHPEDAEALSNISFRSGTSVQADPGIRRGNVEVETNQGVLVRDIDERVLAIREQLREALKSC